MIDCSCIGSYSKEYMYYSEYFLKKREFFSCNPLNKDMARCIVCLCNET
jgi:hypothetical protein